MENNLDVLSESLDMKIAVLKDIEDYNSEQKEIFESSEPNLDSFDVMIDKKAELIERVEKLDEGFEALYQSLSEELKNNKEKYSKEIKLIQQKISIVTELSMSVQASEARNKALIEQYFSNKRKGINKDRTGLKVAYDYYKNMSGLNVAGPQFMDSKK